MNFTGVGHGLLTFVVGETADRPRDHRRDYRSLVPIQQKRKGREMTVRRISNTGVEIRMK